MAILIENLSFTYNPKSPFRTDALKNINLEIAEGEFFGIIGHTGSGKSTLVQHLNALIKLKGNGRIVIDGIDLGGKFDYKKLRSTVGMVFQYPEYQLFDETVAKDVAFGPKNIGMPAEEIPSAVKESIEAVGLNYEEIKDKSPFEISGGQKRRAAIAGVLAMRPKILILDEPTAGLDPLGRREILKLIHAIKSRFCPTVIMISHNMDEIAENCSRIAVLNKGELQYVLPPGELFCHSREIAEMGLDIPVVTRIGDSIGIKGVYTLDGLVAATLEKYRGKTE